MKCKCNMLLIVLTVSIQLNAQSVSFKNDKWVYDARSYIIENFKGYESLYLQNGIAYLKDEQFENGIIEFDIYLQDRVAFAGAIFRLIDSDNYEEIYFRSHHSSQPDAFQYTPKFNGNSSWQLYQDKYMSNSNGLIGWEPLDEGQGYNAIVDFSYDCWIHIKIIVKNQMLAIYLDNEAKPLVVVKELKRKDKSGSIGLRSSSGPSHFANFTFKKIKNPIFPDVELTSSRKEPNAIHSWSVSNVFKESDLEGVSELKSNFINQLKWESLESENTGLLNISKLRSRENQESTVLVKSEIYSEKDQIKKLNIGFSDRAHVYCNNAILYSGNKNFRSRDYRYLGTIGFFDSVYLRLKKGNNTLIIAVSEARFGWGLQAKFDDIKNININEYN